MKKNKKYISVIRIMIILALFLIALYILLGIYKESSIKIDVEESKLIQEETDKEVEKVKIEKYYLDHETSAKLVIPKINLETCVLKNYSKETLDLSPTKYWGPDANDIGNFCIVGHNYKKENMFYDLINLEVGDEFELLDNKNGKYTYTIYDIYKVKPDNTKCLNQETDGKRIVTLITCVNYSNTRLIIKACEKGKI